MARSLLDLDFRPLTLDSKREIEEVTLRFPPYCDFNFASLFVWDTSDDTEYARVGENLVLALVDNKDRSPLYTFMGSGDGVADFADDLIARSIADGFGDALRIVPEEVADVLAKDPRFTVSPDPDNDDYVMSIVRLATDLSGSRRVEANRFREAFPSAVVEPIALRSESERARLTTLFETWSLSTKAPDPLAVVEDRIAFNRALSNADRLGLVAFGVSLGEGEGGDRLVACAIVEIVRSSSPSSSSSSSVYAVSHFQKMDRRVSGISAFLNQAVAQLLAARSVELINFEQDLGVPGLRDAKRSFRPIKYLKKFDVRRRA